MHAVQVAMIAAAAILLTHWSVCFLLTFLGHRERAGERRNRVGIFRVDTALKDAEDRMSYLEWQEASDE